MSRRPWHALPDVHRQFDRIPDDATGRRMVRCTLCEHDLPSLGIGYHLQNYPAGSCVDRLPGAVPAAPVVTPDPVAELQATVDDLRTRLAAAEARAARPSAPAKPAAVDPWVRPFGPNPAGRYKFHPRDLRPGDVIVAVDDRPTRRLVVAALPDRTLHDLRRPYGRVRLVPPVPSTVEWWLYPDTQVVRSVTVERAA